MILYTPDFNQGEKKRGERREVKRIVSVILYKQITSLLTIFQKVGKLL
jgi:hypothetical protein